MGKFAQTWQATREYWKSYIATPVVFAVIAVVYRVTTVGCEVAVNEVLSWLAWVLIPALVGFVAVFLWHYFRDPYVQVNVEVHQIRTLNYYAGAFGEGMSQGDKELIVTVTLIPSKPVRVSEMELALSGRCFTAREFKTTPFRPMDIENAESHMLHFDIPKAFAERSQNARVLVVAKKIRRFSRRFSTADTGGHQNG
jgi:hypothetical protein